VEDDRKHGPHPLDGKIDEVDAAKEAAMTVAELNTQSKASKTGAAFHHILVATDFSEPSRRALCDALVLATENNAQLSVVHVLHLSGSTRRWRIRTNSTLKESPPKKK